MSANRVSDLTIDEFKELIRETLRVRDLTVDEFKELIRETVREVLLEQEQEEPDPDEGLELRPEIIKQLREFEETPLDEQQLYDLEDVAKELGLDA